MYIFSSSSNLISLHICSIAELIKVWESEFHTLERKRFALHEFLDFLTAIPNFASGLQIDQLQIYLIVGHALAI